jgi:hypothetical protein
MQHELHSIESLLNVVIGKICAEDLTDDYLQEVENIIADEQERIKSVFDEKLILGGDNATAGCYFAFHQTILVKLLDQTFEPGLPSDTLWQCRTILAIIRRALEDLLTYIKTNCLQHFNYRQRVPKRLLAAWLGKIADNLRALEAKYSCAAGNRELIDIALNPFKNLDVRRSDLSYCELEYYELVQYRLLSLDTSGADQTILRQDICECLMRVNYNCPLFVAYYTNQFQRILMTCETLSDRVDQASYFYKVVGQIKIETHLAFELSAPNVKEQVLDWLSHERDYLQEKWKLQTSCPPQGDALRADFKVTFDLSVSQVAFLIRTFVETGVIQNKNTSELIRFIIRFVKTKKSETISLDSFRTKFYNTESGTKDAVKKMLQSVVHHMNRN